MLLCFFAPFITIMNQKRRKAIAKVIDRLTEVQEDVQCILDEEQECHDNTPESLQETDRYAESEDAISSIEDAVSSIGDAVDYLSELV